MKKILTLFCAAFSCAIPSLMARNGPMPIRAEDLAAVSRLPVKSMTFKPSPVVGYSSDLGASLGAGLEIGTVKGNYHMEGAYFTRGGAMLHAGYVSKRRTNGIRTSGSISYFYDPLSLFFGFNGSAMEYDRSRDRRNGQAFYSFDKKSLSLKVGMDAPILPHLNWYAGAVFSHMCSSPMDFMDYERGNTLYDIYKGCNLIRENEINKNLSDISAGLILDTRDASTFHKRGCMARAAAEASLDLDGTGYSNLRFRLDFTGYWTPWSGPLTFAARVAWQGKALGEISFLSAPMLVDMDASKSGTYGLGGSETLRGVLSTRLVGEGYAWANLEARFEFLSWNLPNGHWFVGVTPFLDTGRITSPYRLREMALFYGKDYRELEREATRIHTCAGLSLDLGMGEGHMVSLQAGKSFVKGDGPLYVAATLGYLF